MARKLSAKGSACVFCRVVSGELPSAKVWEDTDHIAILDINPSMRGMTLVITKAHFDSYAFEMPDGDYAALMLASKRVARLLEKGLGVRRVAMVMEGLGVNHIHIKLYPLHGLGKAFDETLSDGRVYFDRYDGYLTTQLGPRRSAEELEEVAEQIRGLGGGAGARP